VIDSLATVEARHGRQRSRPTIGLLIENTAGRGEWYRAAVWAGVADAAQELDVNLLSFAGGALERSPFNEFEAQRNLLYELVTRDTVDGLIISGSLGSYVPLEKFSGFCGRYRTSLRVVTIAARLPDIPGVLVDNQQGVREAVHHLIEKHGRRRIAFIRGPIDNSEAEVRYVAYGQALVECGLSPDLELVVPGDFKQESGSEAIDTLLDQRKVRFDAVLAANDYMALGALERLKQRGMRAPDDVSVIGFDGVKEGEAATPPLTTVQQPVPQQGKRAVELLLALLAGQEMSAQETLPTTLAVRQSCGCAAPAVVRATAGPMAHTGKTFEASLAAKREPLLSEIAQAVGESPAGSLLQRSGQLLDAFSAGLQCESPGVFLVELEGILHQVVAEGGDVPAWQGAISALRRYALPCLVGEEALARAENLCQQARVVIGETAQRVQAYRGLRAEQQAQTLREIGEMLITTVEVKDLMDVMARELPRLGIPGCYVSLYERSSAAVRPREQLPAEFSRLVLAYNQGGRLAQEASGQLFPSCQLVPDGVLRGEKRYSLVGVPLHFREEPLGFALFEMGPRDGVIYEALRGQISSALKGALLVQEVRKAQERLHSLYEASSVIVSLHDPQKILHEVVDRMCQAVGAWYATVVLVDEAGHAQRLTKKDREPVDTDSLVMCSGIAVEVMRSGEKILIDDVWRHAGPLRSAQAEHDIRAVGCFPLWLRGRPIGVIWVYYKDPHRFSDAEVDALRLYVNQAAIAYDNARRMRELEHMRKAAEAMAGALEPAQVLQQIVESATKVLLADSSAIWSYDNVRHQFIPEELVAHGISKDRLERFRKTEPKRGGTADTVMNRRWVGVTDVSDPQYDFMGPSTLELLSSIGAKSFQGIVLKVGEEKLGVLYVNYTRPQSFIGEDRRTLETFAYHASLALKKARLLAQVSRARDAAQLVAQVAVLGDREATLISVARGIQKAVDCDAVTLFVYNQATNKLDHPPTMVGVRYPERALFHGEVLSNSIVYEMLRRDELYIVGTVAQDALFRDKRFANDEAIESCVAIPLKAVGQKVGVMFVNFRSAHRFIDDELTNIQLFANIAAVAIRNAQLYEEATERANTLKTLCEAGKTVTSSLTLNEILNSIAKQALNLATPRSQPAHFSYLALVEGQRVRIVAAGDPKLLEELQARVGEIDLERSARIGIIGRVARTGISQNIGDVTRHPDYIQIRSDIRSQLAVPIKISDQVIGIINVEHPERNTFDEEDKQALEHLAAQAAIAIENARHFEDLKKIKGYIGSKTAVDWIRMASTAWGHNIRREVGTALGHVALLRGGLMGRLTQEIGDELNQLENVIKGIKEIPIIAPLSYEDAVDSVQINDLVKTHLERQWTHIRYKPVRLHLKLQKDLDSLATVRTSREWLRRALEILVDNSVYAMQKASVSERQLTVTTQLTGKVVEISVKDSGPGIPKNVLERLFHEPVDKPTGSRGAGIGLMLAQTIVQTYGGDVYVSSTDATGTDMVIVLPIENEIGL